jgi:hypothetical protein
VRARAFERWDPGHARFAPASGPYLLEIGPSSGDWRLTVPVEVP